MPIVVGYVFAHYLTYLLEVGEQTLIHMSDPFSNGSNWFGTAKLDPVVLLLLPPHAAGLGQGARGRARPRAGRDRRARPGHHLLPKKHQLTGQLPLLVAMVAFTVGGLYLLFAA